MSQRTDSLLAEHFRQTRRHVRKLLFRIWGGGLFVIILGFALAWFFVQPAPPRTIKIVTGPKDGAYYRFGELYAEYLKKQGIALEVHTTAGSVQNYELLHEDNGVDLAIVQGGTAPELDTSSIESLASLYFEPVWVFHRNDLAVADLRNLKGCSIAIGQANSGTAAIATLLLNENGVVEADDTTLLEVGGHQAVEDLKNGSVDAALFVLSPNSALIRELLDFQGVSLLSFKRDDAYVRRHPFLTSVTLNRGVIDLEQDCPARDIDLIAPVANLIANPSLHDALVPLLCRAATVTHGQHASLVFSGRLPSTQFVEFPINPSASRFFEEGPPFLQRYLPFWVASAIDRGKILLLPAITLLLPLFRIAPPLYRWSIRSRIFRWYEILRGIESDLRQNADGQLLEKHLVALSEMEHELDDLRKVPLSYMEEFYNLRLHVEFVERRVHRTLDTLEGDVAEASQD